MEEQEFKKRFVKMKQKNIISGIMISVVLSIIIVQINEKIGNNLDIGEITITCLLATITVFLFYSFIIVSRKMTAEVKNLNREENKIGNETGTKKYF